MLLALFLGVGQQQPPLAAREERRGDFVEVMLDRRERLGETGLDGLASGRREASRARSGCAPDPRAAPRAPARRSFSASYSSFASGFTWPSASRRRSQRSRRSASSSRFSPSAGSDAAASSRRRGFVALGLDPRHLDVDRADPLAGLARAAAQLNLCSAESPQLRSELRRARRLRLGTLTHRCLVPLDVDCERPSSRSAPASSCARTRLVRPAPRPRVGFGRAPARRHVRAPPPSPPQRQRVAPAPTAASASARTSAASPRGLGEAAVRKPLGGERARVRARSSHRVARPHATRAPQILGEAASCARRAALRGAPQPQPRLAMSRRDARLRRRAARGVQGRRDARCAGGRPAGTPRPRHVRLQPRSLGAPLRSAAERRQFFDLGMQFTAIAPRARAAPPRPSRLQTTARRALGSQPIPSSVTAGTSRSSNASRRDDRQLANELARVAADQHTDRAEARRHALCSISSSPRAEVVGDHRRRAVSERRRNRALAARVGRRPAAGRAARPPRPAPARQAAGPRAPRVNVRAPRAARAASAARACRSSRSRAAARAAASASSAARPSSAGDGPRAGCGPRPARRAARRAGAAPTRAARPAAAPRRAAQAAQSRPPPVSRDSARPRAVEHLRRARRRAPPGRRVRSPRRAPSAPRPRPAAARARLRQPGRQPRLRGPPPRARPTPTGRRRAPRRARPAAGQQARRPSRGAARAARRSLRSR